MTTLRQAVQQALEHVQEFKCRWWAVPPFGNKVNKATREAVSAAHSPIFMLEEVLTQALEVDAGIPASEQQDKPVAWRVSLRDAPELVFWFASDPATSEAYISEPLYIRPQPTQWVGLTEEQVSNIHHIESECREHPSPMAYAGAIEAKLREKNGGAA